MGDCYFVVGCIGVSLYLLQLGLFVSRFMYLFTGK